MEEKRLTDCDCDPGCECWQENEYTCILCGVGTMEYSYHRKMFVCNFQPCGMEETKEEAYQ